MTWLESLGFYYIFEVECQQRHDVALFLLLFALWVCWTCPGWGTEEWNGYSEYYQDRKYILGHVKAKLDKVDYRFTVNTYDSILIDFISSLQITDTKKSAVGQLHIDMQRPECSASSLASSMPSQILFKVFFKSLLLLYVHKSFSSSGSLLWFCVAFCSGSLYSPTSAVCQPSTCGVSLAAQSGSSPSWPGSPAVGVCTSPPMPAGGAVRPGRWGQGPLYQAQTHREDKGDWKNMIIVRGDITHNFTQN